MAKVVKVLQQVVLLSDDKFCTINNDTCVSIIVMLIDDNPSPDEIIMIIKNWITG